ncbi:MAG: citrate/2-methylcitrate synthase [Armatimonadota bacterium]
MSDFSPGLEGVIAGETSICTITEEGLFYRGYPIAELARSCSFEEVAHLLLCGELPGREALRDFSSQLARSRAVPAELRELVRRIPAGAPPMDALRSAVSLQAHFEPEVGDGSHDANVRKSIRLLAQLPALLAEWHAARRGETAPAPRPEEGQAAYLLRSLTGREPDPEAVRAMDVSLILYAEHELNASTFAARVVVSTLSDLHSGIVAAIGALKGPLHGGANEAALAMLREVGSPERADAWVRERLGRRERIMGFGHRVVRQGDSRAVILREVGEHLARARGDLHWLETADAIQETVEREKGLKPNVDFPCAWVYHLLGVPPDLYTPIFVAARTSGWCAHVIEQLDANRLIRPRAKYIGPEPRSVPPLEQR